LERSGVQGIQFVLSIVLARLLQPEEYGVVALLSIFIAIASVFVQSSFSTALIQKKKADNCDFSSVFFLSLFVAFSLYFLLYVSAPMIAGFYGNEIICPVIRVLAITLFFGAINSVQMASVSRTMQFKRYFLSSMGGIIGSGIISVVLAYKGYGVWSLVAQQLINNMLVTMILWFTVKWRPSLLFSLHKIRELFSFGWKLLVSALLDTIFRNLYGLVIGKLYDADRLGFFNRGQQFPAVIASSLDGSIQSVMLPALSSLQDDLASVKTLMRRSMMTSSYLLLPLMVGLASIAKPMVSVLLTDKWLPCVPFLQLACISYALYPIHTANLTAINAIGRSDVFLKLEVMKKIVTIILLIVSIPFGIYAMAIGQVISSIIATIINTYPNKKLLNYTYFEQIKDLLPPLVLSFVMGSCVYMVGFLPLDTRMRLGVQIVLGAAIYIGFSWLFRLNSYMYLVQIMRGLRK
jgi:O-antigen/teichoic acid export membrane protein